MTTVAADFLTKEIAADSKVSWDYHKGFLTPKLFKVGSSIYGIAGDNHANVFMDWVKTEFEHAKKPIWLTNDVDFDVLELAPDGLYLWDRFLTRMVLKDTNYAIGSGGKYAILAMREMKYSPQQALELACKYDDYTEPPIDVMRLKKKKFTNIDLK